MNYFKCCLQPGCIGSLFIKTDIMLFEEAGEKSPTCYRVMGSRSEFGFTNVITA